MKKIIFIALIVTLVCIINFAAYSSENTTIDTSKLVVKTSSDNTLCISVPPDWTVTGGNPAFMATAPDGIMGVFSTADSSSKMLDPQEYLTRYLLPFFQCKDITIEKREANSETVKMFESAGIKARAENFWINAAGKDGAKLKIMTIISAADNKLGGSIVCCTGFYAPPELFDKNYAALNIIFSSMRPKLPDILNKTQK